MPQIPPANAALDTAIANVNAAHVEASYFRRELALVSVRSPRGRQLATQLRAAERHLGSCRAKLARLQETP